MKSFSCCFGLILCVSGCWGPTATESADRVAIIDLDEVARRIGRDTLMANSVAAKTRNLNTQLKQLQQSLKQSIDSEKSKGIASPSKGTGQRTNTTQRAVVATRDDIEKLEQAANLRLNQAQRQAQQVITKHRLKLVRDFRKEAMDYVKEVAKERGIKIVLTNNDSVVFLFESPVDLTKAVANRMKADTTPAAKTASRPKATK